MQILIRNISPKGRYWKGKTHKLILFMKGKTFYVIFGFEKIK